MVDIARSITISAPAERVFDQLSPPRTLLGIWPSLVAVSNEQLDGDARHTFDWTYRMAGIPLHGHCETLDVERNRRRVDHNTGAIPSTFRWTFVERGDGRAAGRTRRVSAAAAVP